MVTTRRACQRLGHEWRRRRCRVGATYLGATELRLSALSNQGFGVQLSGHATQVTNAVIEDTQPFSEAVESTGGDRNSGQSANGMRRGQLRPHIGLLRLMTVGIAAGIKRMS